MIPGRLRRAVPWALYALVLVASFYPASIHPARMIQLLQGRALAPLSWLTGNPILVFNCAAAVTGLLDAFAARKLTLALGCSEAGSWAAGTVSAFNTYNVHEAPHVHIMLHAFLALALIELLVLWRREEPVRAWRVAGWMPLAGLISSRSFTGILPTPRERASG